MNNAKGRILFVKRHDANAKFVTNDIEILRKNFAVDVEDVNVPKSAAILVMLMRQFFRCIVRISKYDIIYIWFADYHSFIPVLTGRLFGRRTVICAGGYEATYIPEIEMGVYTSASFRKKMRRFFTTYSLRNCSLILPVDDSLISNVNTYIYSDVPGGKILHDGIRNMIPGISTPMKTVRLGYDSGIFAAKKGVARERAVVSAGLITNRFEFMRKGFDILEECSDKMKDVKFILIGLNDEHLSRLRALGRGNLELYGKVTYDELIGLYSKASVYAQLSLFEGMPSSVCEAMLCGCVPVGSHVNGIPDIIGDTGIVVERKDVSLISSALARALEFPEDRRTDAGRRITELFDITKRESEITRICSSLLE
ncbi:MAG: glycosyltransferase family 4 protein [Ignavibacteria bacterium]|nr:glycosyltransferase family 4 protein [Ignavibacteria bacterium]